jgi:hypothetical protein
MVFIVVRLPLSELVLYQDFKREAPDVLLGTCSFPRGKP